MPRVSKQPKLVFSEEDAINTKNISLIFLKSSSNKILVRVLEFFPFIILPRKKKITVYKDITKTIFCTIKEFFSSFKIISV